MCHSNDPWSKIPAFVGIFKILDKPFKLHLYIINGLEVDFCVHRHNVHIRDMKAVPHSL